MSRLEYDTPSFLDRLLVTVPIKGKVQSSRIVRVGFNKCYKYVVLLNLVLLTPFLTPSLLPSSMGFQCAAPQGLRYSPEQKLKQFNETIRKAASMGVPQTQIDVKHTRFTCVNASAPFSMLHRVVSNAVPGVCLRMPKKVVGMA